MRLFDIGNLVLALFGKHVLTDDEIYLVEQQEKLDRYAEFKANVRDKMYNFDNFILSDFRIVETYYEQTLLQGIAVYKEKEIEDKYFSVPVDKETTDGWSGIKEEVLLDIRDAMEREYINDKENRIDV